MAGHDDETMPEETQGYKLTQPKQSLAEYNNMGTFCSSRLPAASSPTITLPSLLELPRHM